MILIFSGPGHPAWNMAVDEALLLDAPSQSSPSMVLRSYEWDRPSVSMGYFLRHAAARAKFPDTDELYFVRRPTGGGLVRHGKDWTYSLIFHESLLPEDARDASGAYRWIHGLLRQTLAVMPDMNQLQPLKAGGGTAGKITDCFAQPSAHDLMLQGEKIAGAAQRRMKQWILHQGTVQGVSEADRGKIALDFAKRLTQGRNGVFETRDLSPAQIELAQRLQADRYATPAWNQKF